MSSSWILLLGLLIIYAENYRVITYQVPDGKLRISTDKHPFPGHNRRLAGKAEQSKPLSMETSLSLKPTHATPKQESESGFSKGTEDQKELLSERKMSYLSPENQLTTMPKRRIDFVPWESKSTTKKSGSSNIWYVSDEGSDTNGCQEESTPCKNLQTVLDRATDGADIYVTSDTLSVDAVTSTVKKRGKYHPCCLLSSSFSYGISGANGKAFTVDCSNQVIHWIVSDKQVEFQAIPSINIRNGIFLKESRFLLYGLASFDNCTIGMRYIPQSCFILYLHPSLHELKSSEETIEHLLPNISEGIIRFNHCALMVQVHVFVYNTVREIQVLHTVMSEENVRISFESEFTFVKFKVRKSRVSNMTIIFWGRNRGFGSMEFTSVQMDRTALLIPDFQHPFLAFHLYSCTFRDAGLNLVGALFVNISNCKFKLSPQASFGLAKRCAVFVKGVQNKPKHFDLIKSIVLPSDTSCTHDFKNVFWNPVWQGCFSVNIDSSVFMEASGGTSRFIYCEHINLILTNSNFILPDNHSPSEFSPFLIFKGGTQLITRNYNVTFDAMSYTKSSVPIMYLAGFIIDIKNMKILCPTNFKAVSANNLVQSNVHYLCEQACEIGQYTYNAGSMVSNIFLFERAFEILTDTNLTEPSCIPCPVGAKCEENIEGLPNYWGLKNRDDSVSMFRCPDGYCCQSEKSCKGIDSCNDHRTGQLCGRCYPNLTESLFSTKCIPTENCPTKLILVLYIAGLMAYALGLLAFNYLKDVAPSILKKLFDVIKSKLRCSHFASNSQTMTTIKSNKFIPNEPNDETVTASIKCLEKEDDAMKYVQILFYFVQDAALFKVKLPGNVEQGESIVLQILQFSPDLLLTLYTNVSDLCFSSDTSAVHKILASFIFGPCVMTFVFLLYVILECFVMQKAQKLLKARLVQTFLLVVLFSYQKMVIAAFTLVQCMNLGNKTVLFVQGDIECYTWWQKIFETYICLSIIPVFFVLSHTPFLVENRKMSIRMFLCSCLLPIPGLMIHYVKSVVMKSRTKQKTMSTSQKVVEIEISSVSEHTVNSEPVQATEVTRARVQREVTVDECTEVIPIGNLKSSVSSGSYQDSLEHDYVFSDSDTDIGSEYSTDLIRVKVSEISNPLAVAEITPQRKINTEQKEDQSKFRDSREAVLHTLLKHYRPLNVFGLHFTWLGVHKLYRVSLVACYTYITDPLRRLSTMSVLLLVMSTVNVFTKPYKDNNTNKVAVLSYTANIVIAMINLWKTALVTFDCKINCSLKDTVLSYFDIFEHVLLVYVPCIVVPAALMFMAVKKCCGKKKKE